MNRETIEKAANERRPYTEEECGSSYMLGKNVGFKRGFMDGAQWRINAVWHDACVSCQPKRMALVLFKNGNAAVYKDLRDLTYERLWGEVDKFAYLDDLLPDGKGVAE